MGELFIAYLYKLRRDLAFRITLIIGGGLALFTSLLYLGLSFLLESKMVSGAQMFIGSLSPTQNFGLAVPINLITFTVMEFSQGGIRNKIIGGHSKAQVYTSLLLNGLVFTFSLMIIYSLLCLGLGFAFGSLINNMYPEWADVGSINLSTLSMTKGYANGYFLKMVILAAMCYISIVSFTVFFATLFRNIGPCIPVIIIVLLFLTIASTVISLVGIENESAIWVGRIVDPLYCLNAGEVEVIGQEVREYATLDVYGSTVTTETLVSGICSNLFYAAAFYGFGLLIFTKRDIK